MSNVEPHHEHHCKISQSIAPMDQEHDEQFHKGLYTKDINSTFIIKDTALILAAASSVACCLPKCWCYYITVIQDFSNDSFGMGSCYSIYKIFRPSIHCHKDSKKRDKVKIHYFDFEKENGCMYQKRVTCRDQVSVNFSNAASRLM
jgi:hypothetical protein